MRLFCLAFVAVTVCSWCHGQTDIIGEPTKGKVADCTDLLHSNVFSICWGSDQQAYHLPESVLSDKLLTVDDIRQLVRKQDPGFNSSRLACIPNPIEQTGGADRLPFKNPDQEIQLISFEQTEDESAPQASTDTKDEMGPEPIPVGTVNGATVYATMDLAQLIEKLKELKEAISSDSQISGTVKSSRLQVVSSANDAILKIREAIGQQKRFETQAANDRSDQQKLKSQLEKVIEPAEPTIDESTVSENLIRELENRRDQLERNKQLLSELESRIQEHLERVTQIPSDRAQANENIEQIREQISKRAGEPDDMDNQLSLILLELKYRAAEAELAKLESEEQRQQLGATIDPIKRDLESRKVKLLEEEIKRWELAVKKLRKDEVREEQKEASEAATKAHWSLKPLAERNELLVEERRKVVERLPALRSELTNVKRQTESIIQRRTEIENKIDAAGLTPTNGMLLVDLRRNLDSTGESHIRIRQLQTELRRVNLKKVGLNVDRDELADPASVVEDLVNPSSQDDPLVPIAMEFVEKKRQYVDSLIVEYQSYGREVSEVSLARKKLIDEINRTLAYIDENALWIRSAEPVSFADVTSVKDGIDQFFAADGWVEMVCTSQQRAIARPYESGLAMLFLLGLLVVKRRVKQKLDPDNERHESST